MNAIGRVVLLPTIAYPSSFRMPTTARDNYAEIGLRSLQLSVSWGESSGDCLHPHAL